jgi:hypothetical protein
MKNNNEVINEIMEIIISSNDLIIRIKIIWRKNYVNALCYLYFYHIKMLINIMDSNLLIIAREYNVLYNVHQVHLF